MWMDNMYGNKICDKEEKTRREAMEKYRNIAEIVVAILLGFGILIWSLADEDESFSSSERRSLAVKPSANIENILSGKYMRDFENYTLDQFPARDTFRSLKALTAFNVYVKKDNNGLYLDGEQIGKLEYPLKEKSVKNAIEKIDFIYKKYLESGEHDIYFAIIPDKNYYLTEGKSYPKLDYKRMEDMMVGSLGYGQYISLFDELDKESYYYTDTHWRQECIGPVAEKLLGKMSMLDNYDNNQDVEGETYDIVDLSEEFYGVYYGQLGVKHEADIMRYLKNDIIDSYVVHDYETNKSMDVYDYEKFYSDDPYEFFLGGSKSLITIENSLVETDRELIIFRDSFGSSIAPLLAEKYAKVTLVDIRYISSALLDRFIEFDNQDILFLYSSLVLNNSETFK